MIAPNTIAPVVAEMSDETITENTIAVNSQHKNMRLFCLEYVGPTLA